ncbi:MAG: 50S ribosomal protein L20 [Atribacterota bacterium]|nr:50S ribosomal protein L20 [Atribacterota bacterium]MDD5637026.1 50S ribosomal protein L20 [Atribacterota bacterium]
MPRVSSSVASRNRRKKILKSAKGYWGGKSKLLRSAKDAVRKSLSYAYRDRRARKRDFRRLWITRIGIAAKKEGISYSQFTNGLKKANIQINRKMLAEIAVHHYEGFSQLVKLSTAESK